MGEFSCSYSLELSSCEIVADPKGVTASQAGTRSIRDGGTDDNVSCAVLFPNGHVREWGYTTAVLARKAVWSGGVLLQLFVRVVELRDRRRSHGSHGIPGRHTFDTRRRNGRQRQLRRSVSQWRVGLHHSGAGAEGSLEWGSSPAVIRGSCRVARSSPIPRESWHPSPAHVRYETAERTTTSVASFCFPMESGVTPLRCWRGMQCGVRECSCSYSLELSSCEIVADPKGVTAAQVGTHSRRDGGTDDNVSCAVLFPNGHVREWGYTTAVCD